MFEALLGILVIMSALAVILAPKPVWAGLAFLLTLITTSVIYVELSAHFIAAMQIFVYAGAIMVIFMFVIVLFQDAYLEIDKVPARTSKPWLVIAALSFLGASALFLFHLYDYSPVKAPLAPTHGTVQSLGKILFIDFFFPFEAVILMFLVALVGAVFIAKRVR